MTLAAITTLPKTTHNTSTLNTGKTSSNYSVKLSLSPHKSSHGTFLDSLTVDWFKIPDVNQRLKRRHTAPAFKTIFYVVFDLVRSQHEFPSRRVDFNPRTYFVRQKTCHCHCLCHWSHDWRGYWGIDQRSKKAGQRHRQWATDNRQKNRFSSPRPHQLDRELHFQSRGASHLLSGGKHLAVDSCG